MKKLLTPAVLILLSLALAACGSQEVTEPETEDAAAVQQAEAAAPPTESEPVRPAELPQALVGSWQIDQERSLWAAAASLEIEAGGAVSFFLGGGADGEGRIVMEDGQAVAYTVSYLEGVEDSFTLTPEEYQDAPCVKMDYHGEVLYWKAATGQEDTAAAPASLTVDDGFPLCLEAIRQNVQLGTSAAFFSAVEQAAALMDWAQTSSMSAAQVETAFAASFAPWDSQSKATFLMQLELVDGAYQQLLTAGQEELLASAGVEDCGYPWPSGDMERVEALMIAAGLR